MKINFAHLFYNLMVVMLIGLVLAPMFGAVPATIVAGTVFAVGCVLPAAPATAGPKLTLMAIQKEIWVKDIADNIYPDNSFVTKCRDDSEFLEGKVVHLPQAGAAPGTQKNRTVLPATASKRTDTEVSYNVDELTTDPVVLTMTDAIEASYPKRMSLLHDHIETLNTGVAAIAAYTWTPDQAANIIRTSGDVRPAYKSTQTGNRLGLSKKDFANASRTLNRMDVPQAGRVCLIDADLVQDLMLIPEFTQAQMIGQANLVEGSIARLFGFDIFVRSSTTVFTNAGTPTKKTPEAATAVTDNLSVLFWHPNFVRFAKGTATNGGIQVFEDAANPLFFGDVFSAMVRCGGRIARTDQRGVVALVETASA